ncbi:hypothetical protein YC2023_015508 [Brassica napus]
MGAASNEEIRLEAICEDIERLGSELTVKERLTVDSRWKKAISTKKKKKEESDLRLTEYFSSMSWVFLVFYTHRIERKNRVMIHFVDDATPNLRWWSSALSQGRGGFQPLLRQPTVPGGGGFFSTVIVGFVLGLIPISSIYEFVLHPILCLSI